MWVVWSEKARLSCSLVVGNKSRIAFAVIKFFNKEINNCLLK